MTGRQEVTVGATHDVHTSTPGRKPLIMPDILREDLSEEKGVPPTNDDGALVYRSAEQVRPTTSSNHQRSGEENTPSSPSDVLSVP